MAENHVLLETIELTQSAASVVFDNIPTTGYTDLKMVVSSRLSTNDVNVSLYFNADSTASNYSNRRIFGDGSTVSSDASTATRIAFAGGGANTTASTYANTEVYFPNYSVAGVKKSYYNDNTTENNATTAYTTMSAMLWQGTAAINTITMFTNTSGTFNAGSTFSLYGIAKFGTTPVTAPFASGGNIVANDGTYWYHAFLSSGTFTPFKALTCETLVIAGGGGAGVVNGGGGGAGGVLYASSVSLLSNTNYTATVGAGGATRTTGNRGFNGSNSVFSSYTAIGGGGGGSYEVGQLDGAAGGSGGGAGNNGSNQTGGTFTAGQGFAGGNSTTSGSYAGAGGGGAGGAGTNSTTTGNGVVNAGGIGTSAYSTWATATTTGVSGVYASGGAGTYGTAGGVNSPSQPAGIANTGQGGGTPNAGGSGIVIVRYPMV